MTWKKEHVLKSLGKTTPSFEKWFPPPADPLTFCSEEPDDWCLSDVWCFAWIPILQYAKCGLSITSFWK